jgi:hypothetical protein
MHREMVMVPHQVRQRLDQELRVLTQEVLFVIRDRQAVDVGGELLLM